MINTSYECIDLASDRAVRARPASAMFAAIEKALVREHPNVGLGTGGDLEVSLARWRHPSFDPQELDVQLARHAVRGALRLRVVLDAKGMRIKDLLAILARCQPYFDRRNAASAGRVFDRILAAHHALHDLAIARAEHAHSLDVWQWMLRLNPAASLAAQIAALFHDIGRTGGEIDEREGGAELTREVLRELVEPDALQRAVELSACYERARDSEETLLNDADALSFFSLNSSAFFDQYGPAHTREEIACTLGRLSPARRALLGTLRLRADVEALVSQLERRAA